MKKLTTTLVLMLVACLLVGANMQKTYSRQSTEYQTAYALCISAGVLPPSPVTPVTGADLAQSLSRIDKARLTQAERDLYDELMEALEYHPVLEYDLFGIDPTPTIGVDMFTQTAIPDSEKDLLIPREDRTEVLDLAFGFKFADVGYGFVDWLMLSPMITSYYDKHFDTNLNKLIEGDIFATSHEGTFTAGILFGNDWMNFSVMSGRQEQGYGHSGNLVLGDNLLRQQYLRMHTFSRWFDYTYTLTRYGKMAYKDSDDPSSNLEMVSNDESFEVPQQVFPLHRFDFKIADSVSISLVEGAMMFIDSVFDVRLLNPFLFVHGFNNYADETKISGTGDEANNILAIELGWTFLPHHRLNLQLVSDQIQIGGESKSMPMALGGLVNYETSWIIDGNYLTGWVEAAYTMPATYLNNKMKNGNYNPNYDYIVGYHMWGYNDEDGDIDYASYKYGPDSIVLALGLDFGKLGAFSLSGEVDYVIHGAYGLGYDYTVAARGSDGDKFKSYNPDDVAAFPLSVTIDEAEHRIEATLKSSWSPVDGLSLDTGLGLLQVWNYRLSPGEQFFDVQLYIGFSFDPVRMFAG